MTKVQDATTSETRASAQLRNYSGGQMQLTTGQLVIVTPKNNLGSTKQT